jgi:argininosuccinate synthase
VDLQRIVLAYSGRLASSAAVRWLIETYGAEVVTVTVDVGQTDDLEEVYARALACGATRAHVVDRCEVFARNTVLPAVARPEPLDRRSLRGAWCRWRDGRHQEVHGAGEYGLCLLTLSS